MGEHCGGGRRKAEDGKVETPSAHDATYVRAPLIDCGMPAEPVRPAGIAHDYAGPRAPRVFHCTAWRRTPAKLRRTLKPKKYRKHYVFLIQTNLNEVRSERDGTPSETENRCLFSLRGLVDFAKPL